jgi:hypothetical protein
VACGFCAHLRFILEHVSEGVDAKGPESLFVIGLPLIVLAVGSTPACRACAKGERMMVRGIMVAGAILIVAGK